MSSKLLILLCAFVASGTATAACAPDMASDREIEAPFEMPVSVPIPAGVSGVILEERGSDFEFRLAGENEFHDITIRPPRLGVKGLPSTVGSLEVRGKRFQGAGKIRIRLLCEDPGEIAFLARLESTFTDRIDAGKVVGLVDEVDSWLKSEADPTRRAWLLQLRSNALEASGKDLDASSAYLAASEAWGAVGSRDRAAVDLMAAGEDLSRAGEYARARVMFDQATPELEASGPNYYRLRVESAKCLILSRMGDVARALNCDIPVIAKMRLAGELSEASAREVSIANQWLKLGNAENARAALLRADAHADSLSKYAIARLSSAFGNYYLQVGDLSSAAREYAQASKRFEVASLPQDQADIDLKLSRLAHAAGAYTEELRLLDAAISHLSPESGREKIANALFRRARANIALGNIPASEEDLAGAAQLCKALGLADCLIDIDLRKVRNAILTNDLAKAREALATIGGRISSAHPLSRYLELADSNESNTEIEDSLRLMISAIPPGDPDLVVDLALASARTLHGRGLDVAASDLLRAQLLRNAGSVRNWPSMALRVGARSGLSRLQQGWIDLLPSTTAAGLSRNQMEQLFEVIDANSAERLFSSTYGSATISESLRKDLSQSVLDGAPIDQRKLFIALAEFESKQSMRETDSGRMNATNPVAPAGHLVILPLLGSDQFRLIVSDGKTSRLCSSRPVHEYRAQAAAFEAVLIEGRGDVRSRDLDAKAWRKEVDDCSSGLGFRNDWWVVSIPGAPMLPWAWIAADAGLANQEEPLVTIGFSWPTNDAHSLNQSPNLQIVDLNLAGADRLVYIDAEIEAISRIFSETRVNSDTSGSVVGMSADQLLAGFKAPGAWIHVVGHGNDVARGQLYSGLWLPGAADAPQLLTMPEILANRSSAELAVLSACGTSVPGQTASTARLGLGEAFVASGVRDVVAISNRASDAAAKFWVSALYSALLDGQPIAQAAQDARRALRKQIVFRHPKYWAGLDAYVGTGS